MNIKSKFELIYKARGEVYNLPPLSLSTLSAYRVTKEDFNYLTGLVKTFNRVKSHPASRVVDKEMDKLVVVNFEHYPLSGFITTKKLMVVNLSPLPYKLIIDYTPPDVFSVFLYSIALKQFINKKAFGKDNVISISLFIFSIFMKLFGKKAGLIGSYDYLIPKLKFLITLYVSVSFVGITQNDSLKNKISSYYMTDHRELDLNYDFSSTKQFLKAIDKNGVMSITENTFSTEVINRFGVSALPMFEDVSRFYATLISSTVPGNSLYSGFLKKINTPLFDKLVNMGLKIMMK